MTVQSVIRVTEMSAGDVTGPRGARCVDGIPDRSPRFSQTICEPTGGNTVRSRDVTTAVQSALPEHQLRTRFRHVYAGRRYAAHGRSSAQSGTSKVFSCISSRYRTDLLRRLKEARSVGSLDQDGSPDARRPGDWLSGRGILSHSGQAANSPRTVGGQYNVEQSVVNVERRNKHGLATAHTADRSGAPGRHTKATDGQYDSPRHDETTEAANTPMTYGRSSSATAAETVCSCPATCRGHDADQADRPYTGHSHPARLRMKLSSRLSHEAQCAINETRRDMDVSPVGSDSVSDDQAKETSASTDSARTTGPRPADVTAPAEDTISQYYCITSRLAQAKDSIYKIRLGKQPAFTPPAHLPDRDNTHAGTYANTHAGTHINTHADVQREHGCRWSENKLQPLDGGLPALTSLAVDGATPSFNVFSSGPGMATYNNVGRSACLMSLSQCYRAAPLLRKVREQTFEITPPWYDSRYTDYPSQLPLCTPIEPPKDIKAQAVQKCRDWLNKYL